MSIFLMGCYDPDSQKWCTVTKCSGGHDDATLARLQKELDMVKISKVRKGAAWPGASALDLVPEIGRAGGTTGILYLCPQNGELLLGHGSSGRPSETLSACPVAAGPHDPLATRSGQGGSHGMRVSFL